MEHRRKQLRFRAWRRGFREIDLILGPYADRFVGGMNSAELDAFARLLDAPDQDAYDWITGAAEPPADQDGALVAAVRRYLSEIPETLGARPA